MAPRMSLAEAHTAGLVLVQQHTARFVEAIEGLDEDALHRPVPGMDWTVGEVIAHVQSVYERYTIDLRRAPSVADLAAQNQEDIARIGVDPRAAAASIEAQLEVLASVVPHIAPDRLFPFHGGGTTTMAGGWGNLLGELLAHGDDIDRATGWGFTIPGPDLEITWCYTIPLLSAWLSAEPSSDASWDLVFEFGTVRMAFVEGEYLLAVDDDMPRCAEHHVVDVSDAAGFTLAVPYRRRPPQDEASGLLLQRFLPV